MSLVTATVLWEEDFLYECAKTLVINCEKLNFSAAKPAWIVRQGCCGQPQRNVLVFENPNDTNALTGIFIESGGRSLVIDTATVANLKTACNACCGEDADTVVPPFYNGTLPATSDPTVSTYCVQRIDNGMEYDITNARLDYYGQYKTFQQVSYNPTSRVAKYQITATSAPHAVGADTLTSGACV